MRVTNQMLNQSAIQAGRPIQGSSLLDYIQSDKDQNGLLSVLSQSRKQTGSAVQKEKFEKLEGAVDDVLEQLYTLSKQEGGGIFARAKESGDNTEICQTVEKFVSEYNQAVKELVSGANTLTIYYSNALKETMTEKREELAGIGITVAKDGTLKVDSKKLQEADIDTVDKVLGNHGTVSVKTAYILARVSEYAAANETSLSSQYNASGSTYASAANKYDFRG